MKKAIGSILCVVGVLLIFSKVGNRKPETNVENIQDWAVIAVVMTIGLPLSQGRKKPQDISEE